MLGALNASPGGFQLNRKQAASLLFAQDTFRGWIHPPGLLRYIGRMIRMNALPPVANADDAAPASRDHGQHEFDDARALVERLGAIGRQSTAEMLQELRRAFPDSPLAVRVRALDALRRR